MKSSKSKDIYDMTNDLIKYIINVILSPLTYCINLCFNDGVFLSFLKVTKVIPIFRSGDKTLLKNYRPISIVPVYGKIIESAVKIELTSYFDSNNLFTKNQFGFRKKLSTQDAIASIINCTYQAMEQGQKVKITACDLTKAFDCVNYDILLSKLAYYGIKGNSLFFLVHI